VEEVGEAWTRRWRRSVVLKMMKAGQTAWFPGAAVKAGRTVRFSGATVKAGRTAWFLGAAVKAGQMVRFPSASTRRSEAPASRRSE
jgi:hypothetical protein